VPQPSAAGGPLSAEPLREIARVRAVSPFCSVAIDHAVTAVKNGVDNDAAITTIVMSLRLRAPDLDDSEMSKMRTIRDLSALYVRLTEQAVAAEHAAKALRTDAAKAPSPDVAKSLTAFADALDGALHRQRTISRDLASMLAYFDVRPLMTAQDLDQMKIDAQISGFRPPGIPTADDTSPPLLSAVARNAADNFVYRQSGIAADERTAAAYLVPAFGDC
jgi:hypothetical protein